MVVYGIDESYSDVGVIMAHQDDVKPLLVLRVYIQ